MQTQNHPTSFCLDQKVEADLILCQVRSAVTSVPGTCDWLVRIEF
jgi:hypothetical protein